MQSRLNTDSGAMSMCEFIKYVPLFLWIIIYTKGTSDDCPVVDGGDAFIVKDRCYWVVTEILNFTEAHKRCQKDGGMLAEIPDVETQTNIERIVLRLSKNYWIGVHDRFNENDFLNMLNETVFYTKWETGQPNNIHYDYKNADCVEITSGGWVDLACELSLPAICSKRNNAIVTTSSQPITTTTMTTPRTTPTTQSISEMTTFTPQLSTQAVSTTLFTTTKQSDFQTKTSTRNVEEHSCMCPCPRTNNQVFIKNEVELQIKVEKIIKELFVNKSLLSSSIRKRTSAQDLRPSATIVGSTLSVVIIATIAGLIVIGDVGQLLKFIWKKICR